MLRCLLCLSILLALTCAARADQLGAAGSLRLESTSAISSANASADAVPALDLTFDPPKPADQRPQAVMPLASPAAAAHDAEAPFSVGLKIKTQRDTGGPPRRIASDPQEPATLTDKVEGIVERSTFGVTGTYRF